MAEILPDLLSAFDAKKMALVKNLAELLSSKTAGGKLEQMLAQNQEDRAKELTSVGDSFSVMPEVAAKGREQELAQGLNLAGMFVGPGGNMPVKELERFRKAQDLESLRLANSPMAQGTKAAEERLQTGWERGLDGNWHREISDQGTKLGAEWARLPQGAWARAGELFPHSDLYQVYPHLQDIKVWKEGRHGSGSWDAKNGWITVGSKGDFNMDRLTLLHELQHAVQSHEGWAPGGSPDTPRVIKYANDKIMQEYTDYAKANNGQVLPDDLRDKLYKIHQDEGYRRLAGEAQARLTELRADMGPITRLQTTLKSQQDVPQSLIIQQPPYSDTYNLPQSLLPGSVMDLIGNPPVKP